MYMQDIGWFDLKYNWTGALVSRLAIDASLIENVSLCIYAYICLHSYCMVTVKYICNQTLIANLVMIFKNVAT